MLVLGALAFVGALPASAGAQPTAAPAHVIDGPSADIVGVGGLSIARDGSGGLVYLKNVGGIAHVFVSRLVDGVFIAPQQIDAGLAGASSQPVIAAANDGLLLAAFVNSGQLLVVGSATSAQGLSAPADLFNGASSPAIAITTLGKAYLAFTAITASGDDVRCAYYSNGQWGLESAPLDASPGNNAGMGAGRPAVAAAGDGVGIIAWGEGGHIYTRRVWGMSPSLVYQQADWPALSGWSEVSADEPSVASGGDSSYAAVAFHEVFSNSSQQQSRVLMQRLQASRYDGLVAPDGLSTPGPEGADQPQVAVGEYGEGFVTSTRTVSNQLLSMRLNSNAAPGGIQRIDSLPNTGSAFAVPATVGYHSALIAWQQDPGALGGAEIRARFFDGSNFDPEQVLSSPATGPAQAAKGLVAAGDIAADVAVAWVQGTGSSSEIVAAQMYQPPGGFSATNSFEYLRTTQPVLSWSASREAWGPPRYDVALDGTRVAETTATSAAIPNAVYPFPLGQGPHVWQVTVTNPAGLMRTDRAAKIFIDTVAPAVRIRVSGKKRVGSPVHVTVRYTDSPPPIPPADASGVAQVRVKFGDRHSYVIRHGKFHVYRRARVYKLIVTVTDRAGNTTTVVTSIKIKAKGAPAQKRKRRHRRG